MEIDLEITFTKDEVFAMCLDRAAKLTVPPVPGKFEARGGFYGSGEVVCTFNPEKEAAKLPVLQPTAQAGGPTALEYEREPYHLSDDEKHSEPFFADNHAALDAETDIEPSARR